MLNSILARLDLPTQMALSSRTASSPVVSPSPVGAVSAEAALPVAKSAATTSMFEQYELVAFERTRLSVSTETRSGSFSASYSLEATFTYSRIATGVPAPAALPAASPQTPIAETDTAVSAPEPESAAEDDAVSNPPASTVAQDAAARPSFSFYEHVLFNATSMSVSMQSRHVSSPQAVQAAPIAPQSIATTTSNDEADEPAPSQAVQRLTADDYAQTFSRLRMRGSESTTETSLSLKLTTREGDTVELDFRQLDVLSRMRLKGVAEGGDRIRMHQSESSMERAVRMNVEGDLSQAELAAIDSLLDEVVQVANKFFSGDVRAAWDKLLSLEFTSDELAEFSLRMSVAQTKQMTKAYQGEDGLSRFAARDKQAHDVLEFLAGEQRSLVESARKHFDDASAVSLVRELLPRMLPNEDYEPATEASAVVA